VSGSTTYDAGGQHEGNSRARECSRGHISVREGPPNDGGDTHEDEAPCPPAEQQRTDTCARAASTTPQKKNPPPPPPPPTPARGTGPPRSDRERGAESSTSSQYATSSPPLAIPAQRVRTRSRRWALSGKKTRDSARDVTRPSVSTPAAGAMIRSAVNTPRSRRESNADEPIVHARPPTQKIAANERGSARPAARHRRARHQRKREAHPRHTRDPQNDGNAAPARSKNDSESYPTKRMPDNVRVRNRNRDRRLRIETRGPQPHAFCGAFLIFRPRPSSRCVLNEASSAMARAIERYRRRRRGTANASFDADGRARSTRHCTPTRTPGLLTFHRPPRLRSYRRGA